ncbi:MAG: glycoside hydrolase [Alphaproteobacteria bacterium]|nr:MAG: glycoside hydrolase [Alphaproteobacteria bacterium]
MEFHAWLNPFRAISHQRFSSVSEENIALRHPEWTFTYGQTRYFDPGRPEVRDHLTQVVMELARGYDLDGLHFDDYFYPYREAGLRIQDDSTFARYGAGFADRHAWRRHNVDTFIATLSDSLRSVAPHLKFGISPVGIWRNRSDDPRGSNSRAGQTSYDDLYADVRLWLERGWIDYVAPQLYWGMTHPYAPYGELMPWWAENAFGRHVYIGHALFKLESPGGRHWDNPTELQTQLRLNLRQDAIRGSIFFSAKAFRQQPREVQALLRHERFRLPALLPPMPWKDSIPPLAPRHLEATAQGTQTQLSWQPPFVAADGDSAWQYVIYRFRGQGRIDLDDPGRILGLTRAPTFLDWGREPDQAYTYVVTTLDRLDNESRTGTACYFSPE